MHEHVEWAVDGQKNKKYYSFKNLHEPLIYQI